MKWWGWVLLGAFAMTSWLYGDRVQAWENGHVVVMFWAFVFAVGLVGDHTYRKLQDQIQELSMRAFELEQAIGLQRGDDPEL
jgi:hypothetical protein